MGNLLKVLTCTELEQGPNFFLDFESELKTKKDKIPLLRAQPPSASAEFIL